MLFSFQRLDLNFLFGASYLQASVANCKQKYHTGTKRTPQGDCLVHFGVLLKVAGEGRQDPL